MRREILTSKSSLVVLLSLLLYYSLSFAKRDAVCTYLAK